MSQMRLKNTLATNQDGLMNVTLYLFHSLLSKGRVDATPFLCLKCQSCIFWCTPLQQPVVIKCPGSYKSPLLQNLDPFHCASLAGVCLWKTLFLSFESSCCVLCPWYIDSLLSLQYRLMVCLLGSAGRNTDTPHWISCRNLLIPYPPCRPHNHHFGSQKLLSGLTVLHCFSPFYHHFPLPWILTQAVPQILQPPSTFSTAQNLVCGGQWLV